MCARIDAFNVHTFFNLTKLIQLFPVCCGYTAYIVFAVVMSNVRMAEQMLNDLICRKISVDDLIAWLTRDHMVIL